MEIEEIEALLEKIWDLHDKLSDAIHSISRAHYLNSLKSFTKSDHIFLPRNKNNTHSTDHDNNHRSGFVYVKDFRVDDYSAIQEAKSLNAIRTALENLEDQLEFFHGLLKLAVLCWALLSGADCVFEHLHSKKRNRLWDNVSDANSVRDKITVLDEEQRAELRGRVQISHKLNICWPWAVQMQQRAERDAAIACLEQSRIVLAMRLAEHQGKKHKVIEEALAFVSDVSTAGPFIPPDNLYPSAPYPPGENFVQHEGKRSSNLIKFLINSFNFAKKSLKLDQMGGIFSNAALVAISMLALLHLQQGAREVKYVLDLPQKQEDIIYSRNARQVSWREGSSSSDHLTHMDVMLARACFQTAESLEHLFFDCPISQRIWRGSTLGLDFGVGRPLSFFSWFKGWVHQIHDSEIVLHSIALLWAIWMQRNSVEFHKAEVSIERPIMFASELLTLFLSPLHNVPYEISHSTSSPQTSFVKQVILQNAKPCIAAGPHMRIIVDGSWVAVGERTSLAWVCFDSDDHQVYEEAMLGPSMLSPQQVEAAAVLHAMRWAVRSGINHLLLQTDCLVLLLLLQHHTQESEWSLQSILADILSLCKSFDYVVLQKVDRDVVHAAHKLATD
ncbi:unnamed protein product [Camellia sinensis]